MKYLIIFLITALLFSCSTPYRIQTVQDYKLVNGKWVKYGQPYTMPDTITIVHAYSWKKGRLK